MRVRARWLVALVVSVALVGGVAGVLAQTAPVRIVAAGDGTLYLLKGGSRYAIAVDGIDDDELAIYADAGALGGSELLAALGASTSASVTREAPVANTQPAPPVT